MTKFNELKAIQLQARKNKETDKVSLYSYLIGMIDRKTKNPTDDIVYAEYKAYIKSIKDIVYANESDSIKRDTDIELVNALLPKQMTVSEIETELHKLNENGISKLPDVMKHFNMNYKGLYDGALVKKLVESQVF